MRNCPGIYVEPARANKATPNPSEGRTGRGLPKKVGPLPLSCPLKCPYDSIRIHNKGTLWAKLCNLMRSYVFLCVCILLYAFLCVPMSYYAFLCFPMCSYVFLVKCSLLFLPIDLWPTAKGHSCDTYFLGNRTQRRTTPFYGCFA